MMKKILVILLFVFSFLILVTSCNPPKPSSQIIGKWKETPNKGEENETFWDATFYKDGTIKVKQFIKKIQLPIETQGTYKFINDEKSIDFSLTFGNSNFVIIDNESSVLSLIKIDNDSLILSGEYGKIHRFHRLK